MTFARTATAGDANSASSTTLVTSSFASVSGRLIVGYVGWEGGNTTISSVVDTAGNTYVIGTPVPHGTLTDQCVASFYCLSSLGNAANVITATLGAARGFRVIQTAEYSSAASVVFDGSAYGESLGAATTTTAAIATTGAIGLLFAGAKSYNSTTFTAGGSLSLIAQQGTFGADEDQILTASGSYTATINHGTTSVSLVALAFKEGASGPTVTSVTAGSVAEAGARNVVVALSAATTATTPISCSLVGVDATGSDLTLSLNGVTCTNGVTCDGTNFSVPSGVSGWSFDVQTTADALDEANETATITIGGQTATITITDDDPLPYITGTAVVTVNRGESVVITVTLGAASGRVTQARLTLTDGTAVGGVDYTNVITNGMFTTLSGIGSVTINAGVLTIPAGVGSFTITIPTAG